MIHDTDIAIVGAGAAGIAAATTLRSRGIGCVVIEAAGRVGGRAHTTSGPETAHHWFDHGATWLHHAERNPLTAIARARGTGIIESDRQRTWRLQIGGRAADAGEHARYHAAWARFEATVRPRGAEDPDIAFSAAMDTMRDDPWAATIELWEAAQIAAADPARLSLRDWLVNDLDGSNLILEGGIGHFLAGLAAEAGPIALNTPATAIDWSDGARITTPRGVVRARGAIVTVSTGVLQHLAFSPALPVSHQDAIANLPMGLLTKLAFPARGADRLGLGPTMSIRQQARPGMPAMGLLAWPYGAPYMQSFIGGPTAWALAAAGPAATDAFARGQIATLLGADALKALGPALVTPWATDPWHRGSYAFATVGHAGARAVLGTPVGDGRLVFAGEAVRDDGLAGTIGGAWASGVDAAQGMIEALRGGEGGVSDRQCHPHAQAGPV